MGSLDLMDIPESQERREKLACLASLASQEPPVYVELKERSDSMELMEIAVSRDTLACLVFPELPACQENPASAILAQLATPDLMENEEMTVSRDKMANLDVTDCPEPLAIQENPEWLDSTAHRDQQGLQERLDLSELMEREDGLEHKDAVDSLDSPA